MTATAQPIAREHGSDTPTVLVVDPNLDSRLDVTTAARHGALEVVGEAMYGPEATVLAIDVHPAVILMALEEPPMRGFATLDALQRQAPEIPVLVYSSSADPALLRAAMRAGARDFLAKPLSAHDLREAVDSAMARGRDDWSGEADRLLPTSGRGTIITVAGAKGGIGKSTLAANLALALRKRTGQEVALLDADVQFGDVGVMLDLTPAADQCVSYLARESGPITRQSVAECLLHHSSGVAVLGVFPEPEDWRLANPERIAAIAVALAELHEYVVVDTPGTFNELVAASVSTADIVLLVTSLEMSSIKDTQTAIRILNTLAVAPERIRVVINDSTGAHSVTAEDVAKATGLNTALTIPHDRQLGRSVQRGIPILIEQPSSKFAKAVTDLAGAIAGVSIAPTQRQRAFRLTLSRGAR